MDGNTTAAERGEMVDKFNNPSEWNLQGRHAAS